MSSFVSDHPLPIARIRTLREYRDHAHRGGEDWLRHQRLLAELEAGLDREASFRGWSWPAGREVAFGIEGRAPVNWREDLRCPQTGLVNRMRASVHVFELECRPRSHQAIYLMECRSPVHDWMRRRYDHLVGSEYLGDGRVPGCIENGLRHEDATRLSFADGSLDFVLSFDVFEHVPDYRAALAECARVLRPDGRLLLSVPFDTGSDDNQVRASRDPDGNIVHHAPPDYHADPLNPEGILSWYTFGWDLLGDLRAAGFADAWAVIFRSEAYGYLGEDAIYFVAGRTAGD